MTSLVLSTVLAGSEIFPINIQVLTFIRTDRKAKNNNGDSSTWICLLVDQLRAHMKSKGMQVPASFQESLASIYKGSFRSSAQNLFLKPGSSLQKIPTGEAGRQSPECLYVRSVMVECSVISKETLQKLDKGLLEVYRIMP